MVTCIRVVFSFMGLLLLDHYHTDYWMILKETLTFLRLSNSILQYSMAANNTEHYMSSGRCCYYHIFCLKPHGFHTHKHISTISGMIAIGTLPPLETVTAMFSVSWNLTAYIADRLLLCQYMLL